MTLSLARNLCHSVAILVSTTKIAGPRSVRATHYKDADVQQSHDSHDATPYRNPEDRDGNPSYQDMSTKTWVPQTVHIHSM
jgi:hypothetical protein